MTAMVYIMDERRRPGKPSGTYYGVLERAYGAICPSSMLLP